MENTICPQCGGPVKQTGLGRPRRFCKPDCGVKFANDLKPRKHGKDAYDAKRHMLTNLSPDKATADCSRCGGRVRVWSMGGKLRCSAAVEAQASRIRHKRGRGRERSWERQGIHLTVEQYDEMVEAQDGLCLCCGNELGEKPHVDHCHTTGEIRGVTCRRCNRVLGLMEDDPEVLRRAAEYLDRNLNPALTEA